MKIRLFSQVFAILIVIFALSPVAMAQTAPPAADGTPILPAYCTPLPEDIDQLQDCNDLLSQFGIQNYDDTSDPVTGPGSGIRGMASAFNSREGTLLFVSTSVNGLDASIIGQIYDAQTMEARGGSFVIDTGRLSSGSPRAVYNNVNNSFFVTWLDERPSRERSSIYARTISADGSMPASDFAAYESANVFIGDLTIDYPNSRYVQGFDLMPDGPRMITISFADQPGPIVNLDNIAGNWEGHSSVTYNSTRNEYWYAYATVVAGGESPQQDGRIMFRRVDAATMQPIGEAVQVSRTRIGPNAFDSPQIAYSAQDGSAVIAWQERGRTPGMASEVYGRTIYDDLTMSDEYPLLTSTTHQASNFYGAPNSMQYNPATGTYAMAVEDNNGGTTFIEFFGDGTILEIREIISPQGTGNFNPSLGSTGSGFTSYTSSGYSTPRIVTYNSPYRGNPTPVNIGPGPSITENLDTTSLAQFLSRIYLYAIAIAGMLAVVMSVFGGYLVMSARGNGAQATRGREYIYSSLVGLVLLLAAFLILNTLNPDLTQLDVPSLRNLEL